VIRVRQPKVHDLQERSNKSNSSNQKRHVKTENAHNTAQQQQQQQQHINYDKKISHHQNKINRHRNNLWSPNPFLEMPILKVAPEAVSFFCHFLV
jgi:hypothetical protein